MGSEKLSNVVWSGGLLAPLVLLARRMKMDKKSDSEMTGAGVALAVACCFVVAPTTGVVEPSVASTVTESESSWPPVSSAAVVA